MMMIKIIIIPRKIEVIIIDERSKRSAFAMVMPLCDEKE
jgi:hypothetical protein